MKENFNPESTQGMVFWMIVCTLWTVFIAHPDGHRKFLNLNSDDAKRNLNLNWFNRGNQWNEDNWFLALPQVYSFSCSRRSFVFQECCPLAEHFSDFNQRRGQQGVMFVFQQLHLPGEFEKEF